MASSIPPVAAAAAKSPTTWVAILTLLLGGGGVKTLLDRSEASTRVMIHEAMAPQVTAIAELRRELDVHMAIHSERERRDADRESNEAGRREVARSHATRGELPEAVLELAESP